MARVALEVLTKDQLAEREKQREKDAEERLLKYYVLQRFAELPKGFGWRSEQPSTKDVKTWHE